MILVALRSRLRPEREAEYRAMAQEIASLARAVPGYVAHKTFTAEDGERVTLVEYESEAAMQAWSRDPMHRRAKQAGRQDFFSEYRLQVCTVLRDHSHGAGAAMPGKAAAAATETGDALKLRALSAEEQARYIARAEMLRQQAVDAAFLALGRWIADLFRRRIRPAGYCRPAG